MNRQSNFCHALSSLYFSNCFLRQLIKYSFLVIHDMILPKFGSLDNQDSTNEQQGKTAF